MRRKALGHLLGKTKTFCFPAQQCTHTEETDWYTDRQIDQRQTDRLTDRHINWQTDRPTDRQMDRQTAKTHLLHPLFFQKSEPNKYEVWKNMYCHTSLALCLMKMYNTDNVPMYDPVCKLEHSQHTGRALWCVNMANVHVCHWTQKHINNYNMNSSWPEIITEQHFTKL